MYHLGNVSLEIGIRNICNFGVVFIYLLYDIASDVNFTSHNLFDLRVGIVTSFSSNVNFVFTLFYDTTNTDKISVGHWPYAFVLLIVDFEDIFLLIQNFQLNNLTVHFSKRLFFFQKLNNLSNGIISNSNSLGRNSLINGKFIHGTRFSSILFPFLRFLKFF